jgi:hypothetical protein
VAPRGVSISTAPKAASRANTPITRIGFRQDGSSTAASQLLQLEVRMGRTLGTSTTLGTTYDTNFQGASNTVFGPALYTLPGFTSGTTAAPVWINLTTPYVYDGTSTARTRVGNGRC